VQDACAAITKDWSEHGAAIRAAAATAVQDKVIASSVAKLSVTSTPDGADIEIDGAVAGNTPSTLELVPGEHTVSDKKSGYSIWQRKLKLTGGSIRLNVELRKVE
jgi:diacylglycerol kinase family enzyme